MTSEAENAYYNKNANLTFRLGRTDEGETLHIVRVWALADGRVLEVRENPRTTQDESIVEFESSSVEAWNYLYQIEMQGRLMA